MYSICLYLSQSLLFKTPLNSSLRDLPSSASSHTNHRSFDSQSTTTKASNDDAYLQTRSDSTDEDLPIHEKTLTQSKSEEMLRKELINEVEKRQAVMSPFADPFPMPTPNRALMHASGDSYSPIARNSKQMNGPSLTSMLALEKRDHYSTRAEQNSPKAQSDSGNSNGSAESEESVVTRPARVLYDYTPTEDDEMPLTKGRYNN